MVRIKVKLGSKGQLVIPKVIRESLGLTENIVLILEVKDKKIEIRPLEEDVLEKWEEIAKREGVDVSKEILYGDKLYEEVF
ncbi:MAG: AbrB/MazE/SpoVT family DNA-binding domain-containing protein [archaeon]|nr:AbrB/MazE/SpoVT family DNA-binding domain-containing protein [archaeon]MCP8315383.1 AbrB/MazE/SpoVT family DNA-binding domain-containing protein [archaeon]MCP8322082.1 AbrB/MazE/SpoVT family DNA-binding domain-containing protein [archaeon]